MLEEADPSAMDFVDIVVCDGVVHIWGAVRLKDEVDAIRIVAENVAGVEKVQNQVSVLPSFAQANSCAEWASARQSRSLTTEAQQSL